MKIRASAPQLRGLALVAALAMGATAASGQPQGVVRERLSMLSTVLGEAVHYTVYLPPGYDASARSYPVVYLLHGYTDDDTAWIQFGEAHRIADAAIASGDIPPLILVMPEGRLGWYVNDHADRVRWESMFVEEFIPHIEAGYRVRAQRMFRGIAGQSMGGYGALTLSMHHPELFAAVAALGNAIRTDDEMRALPQTAYDNVFGPVFGRGLAGDARLTEHWRRNNPLDLAARLPADRLKSVRYLLDCGDDDHLTVGNAALHILLTQRSVPHEYRVRDGAHTWRYWRQALPEALRFIGESFRK